MSRCIDADKLKEECYKFTNDVPRSAMAFVQGQINAAPTADVDDLNDGELSQVEIARKHGVSRQYITKIKRKLVKWEEKDND